MADKRRFLDVWIVESNTVYREVPFTVVADWVQQGRLLENDMLKPSGTTEWGRVGASTDFNAYVPKPQAYRSEDQAEALEPVQLDFAYKHRHEDEDDDVDMIPLIDVSLVLLIFFMLLSAGAGISSAIPVPGVDNPTVSVISPDEVTVGIDIDQKGRYVYSIGIGNHPPSEERFSNIHYLNEDEWNQDPIKEDPDKDANVVSRLKEKLVGTGRTEVTINANKDVRSGTVRKLTSELGLSPLREHVSRVLIGVNEKK